MSEPLSPDPGEIEWHAWLTVAELREVVDERRFVPAGRRALRQYLESESGNPS